MANSHPGLGLNLGVPAGAPKNANPQLAAPSAIGITPASPTDPSGPSPTAGPSKTSPRQGLQPLQTQFDSDHYDQRGHSIPPPPSPRRHRVSRVRGGTGGGISTSKSWADLTAMGVAIGSSRSPGVKEDRRAVSEHHRVFSHGDLTEEPSWDEAPYDNSARFYYRMHSRAASPVRSTVSVSPTAGARRSPSPSQSQTLHGSSPIHVRRNLSVPPGVVGGGESSSSSPTSATRLSPNTRFLQQHLPPTFPNSTSLAPTPEHDIADPMAAVPMPPQHMVILTPTTQEWRELKEMGRLGGEQIDDSHDSDSSSSSAPSPSTEAPQRTPPEADGSPQLRPVFSSIVIAPSPAQPQRSPKPEEGMKGAWVNLDKSTDLTSTASNNGGLLTPDDDDDITLAVQAPTVRRFNSIGRRDSLVDVQRPAAVNIPRTKTKREIERERLLRLVDEEIAGSPPSEPKGHSWGVQEIGTGGGLSRADSRGSQRSRRSLDSPGLAEAPPEHQPPSEMEQISQPLLPPVPCFQSDTLPTKPSPLHADPVTRSAIATPSSATTPQGTASPATSDESPPLSSAPPETEQERFESIRNYSRSFSTRKSFSRPGSAAPSRRNSAEHSPPRSPRRRERDTPRVSLVAGRIVRPLPFPPLTPMTQVSSVDSKDSKDGEQGEDAREVKEDTSNASKSPPVRQGTLSSFSAFRSPAPGHHSSAFPPIPRFDSFTSNVSHASSVGAPSSTGTPHSEVVGAGGHGIDDYVILKEAGKGAYGLVMRAKVKGSNGQPVGEELIIKYVIKSRILADCWKKHKQLGPIPVEIHVMDQLRHLIYHPPVEPHPWDPHRTASNKGGQEELASNGDPKRPSTPLRSDSASSNPTQRYISGEMKQSPERGHPNVCKLLDFFEDREFYYLVMPRYGTGVDLFDYVESHPSGLPAFEVRSFVGQLTDAVRFLHANGIVHRDIKDENVILDGTGKCQLIDFGSAAHWRPGKRWDTFSGTLHYASPEILRGEMYGGKEQDVWALGTVAYVLLVGETPFTELPDEVFEGLVPGSGAQAGLDARCGGEHVKEGLEADGGGSLEDAADFVRCCLAQDLVNRPTAAQLLKHRYLAGAGGWTGFRGWMVKSPAVPGSNTVPAVPVPSVKVDGAKA